MGRFTDDMAQLRSNIDSTRVSRLAEQNTRISNVASMLKTFDRDHQAMGRQGRKDRAAFVSNVTKQTLSLLNGFHSDHKSMANRTAKERADFVAGNKSSVGAFIKTAAQDRAGAHAAFFGTASSKKKVTFQV
ncbi:MAG: hypothetical protein WCH01_15535 [Methylococcaceae bacterium]